MELKTFYEAIGYAPYQELRVFDADKVLSFFPKNFEETKQLLEQYQHANIYVGVNPRKNRGGKSVDVAYRSMMVFDIEAKGNKPPLSNEKYRQDLEKAIGIIRRVVKKKTKADLTFIVSSGRGIHLYFRLVPIEPMYQEDYLELYEELIKGINYLVKKYGIKADPPVKDLPRIFGAPGTKNVKYEEESAQRKILFYENTKTEILPVLLDYRKERKNIELEIKRKDNPINYIMRMPEFKLFKLNPQKGTRLNGRPRFALRMKMREIGMTREECEFIAKKIHEFGNDYKPMYLSPTQYKKFRYSKSLIHNWCKDNFVFCVEHGFPYPYPPKEINKHVESKVFVDFPARRLGTWKEVTQFAADFNNATMKNWESGLEYFTEALRQHLEKNCNEKLWMFIEEGNLMQELKYRLKSIEDYEKDNVSDYILEEEGK